MKITFEDNELAQLAQRLSNWYDERTKYVLSNFPWNLRNPFVTDSSCPAETLDKLQRDFEKTHPRPGWRELL